MNALIYKEAKWQFSHNSHHILWYFGVINKSHFWNLVWSESFVGVYTASMTIWPDHCHCIVPFFFNFTWEYLRVNLLFLQQHCPSKFINTGCAFTWDPKSVRIDFLLLSIVLNNDLSFSSIIEDKNFIFFLFLNLIRNTCDKSWINLGNRVLLRQNHRSWSPIIRISGNLAHQRNFRSILNIFMNT